MNLQRKVWDIYTFLKENIYLCRNDISISDVNLNSTLLFGLITALNFGKELIYGEYGLGKTTSSENIISMIYSFPTEIVLASALKGNPEQTEEKMIGRPNIGMLNQGIEKVIWSDFVLIGPKIIDEINRLPPSKQNILLEGTDRGVWKYLNEIMHNDSSSIFSTANYADLGNNEIIPPLLDRFDIAVESKHPGINNLRYRRAITTNNLLSDKDIADDILNALSEDVNKSNVNVGVFKLKEKYRQLIKKRLSIDLLDDIEISSIREQIRKISLSKDAMLFYDLFSSELSSCQIFGQKRSNEGCKEECVYSKYLCGKVNNCLSVRSDKSLKNYSAALAWLFGKDEISTEHLALVLPYAIWHKTRFKKEFIEEYKIDVRTDPINLYVAKKSVEDLKKRFSENRSMQEKMVKALYSNNTSEASSIANKNDHPVYREYLLV